MTLKKKSFSEDEVVIFDDAVIYKRNDYWHFRIWLKNEKKYARFSLKTRNQSTAVDKAKLHYHELMANQLQGKSYFSITTKIGVERYLEQRWKDHEAGLIVKGRYSTIKTHLDHWLDFIGRDTKLRELDRNDCENYFHERTKTKKGLSISQTTVINEQSTINALLSWLYKSKETYIEAFDFKKLKRIDRGDETIRRSMFSDEEIQAITLQLEKIIAERVRDIDEGNNLTQVICAYHHLISIMTGMRRGEQLQLRWKDVGFLTLPSAFSKYSNSMVDDAFDLAKAFVSSVTYGMTKSSYARGQIQMVDALLSALVRGESVGPVNAIAQDYKVLELKGVVEVKIGSKKGRTGPMLRLLKTEVGELALQAIRQGDVSEYSLSSLPTATVTNFSGPEHNREKVRRTQTKVSPKATNDMLSILRTGGGL